jgi:hypothetical protein
MGNSKDILDRLVDELGDALVLDRGSDSAFKAQVYQGLLRAQQAMGTCLVKVTHGSRTFKAGRQQPASNLTSQQKHNPLEDDALITAHSQLRQIFGDAGQWRQRHPKKVIA